MTAARGAIAIPAVLSAVLSAMLAAPRPAAAAVTIDAPVGWITQDRGPARARALSWIAARPGARLIEVHTPRSTDGFAEVLALVELDGAFDTDAPEGDELARAMDGLPGFAIATAQWSAEAKGGVPRLRATWEHDAIAYRCELVASGTTRTLLVLATLADEALLYGGSFAATSASVRGAQAPMTTFDRGRWRVRALMIPGVLLAALVGVTLWRRPFGASARVLGQVLAAGLVVLSLFGAWITLSITADDADALRRVHLVPGTLAAEVATYGLVAAVLVWVLGIVLARGERTVASAPRHGAFADRAGAPLVSTPMLPRVPEPGVAPPAARQHPDGASRLEPTEPPSRAPRSPPPSRRPSSRAR